MRCLGLCFRLGSVGGNAVGCGSGSLTAAAAAAVVVAGIGMRRLWRRGGGRRRRRRCLRGLGLLLLGVCGAFLLCWLLLRGIYDGEGGFVETE